MKHYVDVREIIRNASGETIDLKSYEADMRHLLDAYIEANEPRNISPFDTISLLDLIVKSGIAAAINSLPTGMKTKKKAIAETIDNNVRRKITREHLNDPAFYNSMSDLLEELIRFRKERAEEYEECLQRIAELARQVGVGNAESAPFKLDTPGKRALWNNLKQNEALALQVDEAVKIARPDAWRGVQAREQVTKAALYEVLKDDTEVERIFEIVRAQEEY